MAVKNTSVDLYCSIWFLWEKEISSETSLFTTPLKATRTPLRKSPTTIRRYVSNAQKPVKGQIIYCNMSRKNRQTLPRCGSNENIRALLSYMRKKHQKARKKHQKGNSAERRSGRRRSIVIPKQSTLSSKIPRQSPQHDRSSL